ncbi:MAG: FAD-dependent oxidoreductase [Lachnospiraceae bacterium]|nr:FAD-dependent oxidoreductase [Lachnospiraceae bacterium]
MIDLLIVGAGPAGMGAAIYAVRAGMEVLVIEKNPMCGGQILNTYEVDNYLGLPGIGGFDLGMKFKEHGEKLGIPIKEAEVTEVVDKGTGKLVRTTHGDYEARALIWAAGAEHAKLGVPGEEELSGKGVSYCATCDGAFYRNQTVAVVGGSDVAAEDAVFLAKFCEKVYIIHRRDKLRAAKSLQDKIFSMSNIEILWNTTVEKIGGKDRVETLLLKTQAGEEDQLAVSGVFIAVGIRPDTALIRELVDCDENGYILAGENCVTTTSGIFAAGDVRQKPLRQIITAVADGANAVAAVEDFLLLN